MITNSMMAVGITTCDMQKILIASNCIVTDNLFIIADLYIDKNRCF